MLEKLQLSAFQTASGAVLDIQLSYELFGQPVHSAPMVMVNHALTGNSHVAGPDGWWNSLIGPGLVIDTDKYTVLPLIFQVMGTMDLSSIITKTLSLKT